jgi:hypothetical protein
VVLTIARAAQVNVLAAYLVLFVAGPTGAHLAYVDRPLHAALCGVTLGFCGLGLLRDLWSLPRYVREANSSARALRERSFARALSPDAPRSYLTRVLAQVAVGAYFGCAAVACDGLADWFVGLYGEHIGAHVWHTALEHALLGLGTALGVWAVGNVGDERASLRAALAGAALGLLSAAFTADTFAERSMIVSIVTTVLARFGRAWRPLHGEPLQLEAAMTSEQAEKTAAAAAATRRVGVATNLRFCTNLLKLYTVVLAFLSVLAYGVYSHGVMSVDSSVPGGLKEKVKVKLVVDGFLRDHAPELRLLRVQAGRLYEFLQDEGLAAAWRKMRESSPQFAANAALAELELPAGADRQAIKKQFRKLSLEFHPDRHVGKPEPQRLAAQRRFESIVQAYELLTSGKD